MPGQMDVKKAPQQEAFYKNNSILKNTKQGKAKVLKKKHGMENTYAKTILKLNKFLYRRVFHPLLRF